MFHPDFDDYGLGKERMAQMRKEVQHNRLEARLAKARLGEEAVPRRGGVLTRRTAFVAALAVEARVRVRALLLTVAARRWCGLVLRAARSTGAGANASCAGCGVLWV
jgi:hypothetical protein